MGDWVRLYSQYIYTAMANEYLDKTGLNTFWQLIKTAINTLITMVNGKADKSHTHFEIHSSNTQVLADGNNVFIRDSNGSDVIKVLNPNNSSGGQQGVEIWAGTGYASAEFSDSTSKIYSPDSSNVVRVNDDEIRIKYGGTGHTQEVKIDGTEVKIKQSGSDYVALQIKVDETSLKYANSSGVRLKSTSTECKFSGKGLTIDASNSKLTAASKVRLIAPTIEISNGDDGDAALTLNGDNIGNIVQRLNVQPHVELMCIGSEVYVICDTDYIKSTDEVVFFRYIRGKNRYSYRADTNSHRVTVGHRTKSGWRQPLYNTNQGSHYPTAVYANMIQIQLVPDDIMGGTYNGYEGYDVWRVQSKTLNASNVHYSLLNYLINSRNKVDSFGKKCGLRIRRDGEWVTDYLPFMPRIIEYSTGTYTYVIGRWT